MHAAVGDRKLSRTHGVRKLQLYMFKTKTRKPQSPLCPNPLDAEKCHFWQKKKYASLLFKKKSVKMLFLFFFCKILQFIVIYKCKLWYQLTFL